MFSRSGRMDAGEFNSPRPPRNGSAGINTRTFGTSVRVGRSTTTRQHPSHHTKSVGFERCRIPRNCAQLLRIKVFNPRRNCIPQYGSISHRAYAIHPRGQAPRHSRCITVDRGDTRRRSRSVGQPVCYRRGCCPTSQEQCRFRVSRPVSTATSFTPRRTSVERTHCTSSV